VGNGGTYLGDDGESMALRLSVLEFEKEVLGTRISFYFKRVFKFLHRRSQH